VEFFQKLLGTSSSAYGEVVDYIIALRPVLSVAQSEDLIRPVIEAEIKTALCSIDGNKSPGPDGFSSEFSRTLVMCVVQR